MSSENKRAKTSIAWEYFTVHDEKTSTGKCKICGDLLSFRASVSNLMKHVKRCHRDVYLGYERFDSSDNETNGAKKDSDISDSEAENAIKTLVELANETKTVEIHAEEDAVCLFCKTKLPDNESSTLMDHMVRVHKINKNKIVDGAVQFEQVLSNQKKRKRMSMAWTYCSLEDPVKRVARCNLCDTELSFKSTVANLNKHLKRTHGIYQSGLNEETDDEMVNKRSSNTLPGELKSFFNYTDHFYDEIACVLCKKIFKTLDGTDNLKTHLMEEHPEELLHSDIKYLPTNGDPLYIKKGGYDKEKDQTDMEEEYLESEDDFDTRQDTPRRQNLEWSKRKKPLNVKPKIWDRNVKIRRLRPYFPEKTKQTQNLEYFSKYVTSLLQDLPDMVSKKLQMDFIKNILEAQISCNKKACQDRSTITTDLNPNSNIIVNGRDGIVIEVLSNVTNGRGVSEDSVPVEESVTLSDNISSVTESGGVTNSVK